MYGNFGDGIAFLACAAFVLGGGFLGAVVGIITSLILWLFVPIGGWVLGVITLPAAVGLIIGYVFARAL